MKLINYPPIHVGQLFIDHNGDVVRVTSVNYHTNRIFTEMVVQNSRIIGAGEWGTDLNKAERYWEAIP